MSKMTTKVIQTHRQPYGDVGSGAHRAGVVALPRISEP